MSDSKPMAQMRDLTAVIACQDDDSVPAKDFVRIYQISWDACLSELQRRGGAKFDDEAFRKAVEAFGFTSTDSYVAARRMAIWQHQQSAALLAARDVKIKDQETEFRILLDSVNSAVSGRDVKVRELERTLKHRDETIPILRDTISKERIRISDLEGILIELKQYNKILETKVEELKAERDLYKSSARPHVNEVAIERKEHIVALEKELSETRELYKNKQAQVMRFSEKNEVLETDCAGFKASFDEITRQHTNLEKECANLKKLYHKFGTQLGGCKIALESSEMECARLREALINCRMQFADLMSRVKAPDAWMIQDIDKALAAGKVEK